MTRHVDMDVPMWPKRQPFSKKTWTVVSLLLGALLFTGVVAHIYLRSSSAELVMLLQASSPTSCRLAWSNLREPEVKKTLAPIDLRDDAPTNHRVALPPEWPSAEHFYLGPCDHADIDLTVLSLLVKRSGYKPRLMPMDDLVAVSGETTIRSAELRRGVMITGMQELRIPMPTVRDALDVTFLAELFLFCMLIAGLVFYLGAILKPRRYGLSSVLVIVGLAVASALSASLSLQARYAASPDEHDHFLAAEFFMTHSDVPHMWSETGAYTYNGWWAYSRVYQKGYEYRLAGIVSNLLEGMTTTYRSVRLAGPLLFAGLALLALLLPRQSLMLIPLLLTPQVWYVFSYVNDDYLPLFTSFVLLVLTEAGRRSLAKTTWDWGAASLAIVCGGLLGVLMLSKINYGITWGLYLVYLLVTSRMDFSPDLRDVYHPRARFLLTLRYPSLILLAGLLFVGGRTASIVWNADPTPPGPGTVAFFEQAQKNHVALFEAGKSGQDLFESYRSMLPVWLEHSGQSLMGVYGYLNIIGPLWYYRATYILCLFCLLSLAIAILLKRKKILFFWMGMAGTAIVLAIVASSYFYSYKFDWSPQGRYLFPALPVIGLMLARIQGGIELGWLRWPAMLLFVLSAWSMLFVGLVNL